MDEVRSSGSSNPFGQVETTSRESCTVNPSSNVAGSIEKPELRTLSSHMSKTISSQQDQFIKPLLTRESTQQQIEQSQDNIATLKSDTDQQNTATRLDCNVNPVTPSNDKANFVVSSDNPSQMLHFQNCPVAASPSLDTQPSLLQSQTHEQTKMQASLLQESQNSVSSLQNILNSLTLKYIQTQVSLEPLLDIQNTINFLKNLQNPQSSPKHENEFKQGIELAINTLLNAQPYQDLHMQATLEGTIQILQTLLLKHKDKSLLKCAEPTSIVNNESTSRQYTLRTSSLDRKGKLHYNSTHSFQHPSLLTKALLDFKTTPTASHFTFKSDSPSKNCHVIKPNQTSNLTNKSPLSQDVFTSPPLSPAFGSNHNFFNKAASHSPYDGSILSSVNHIPCSSKHLSNHNNQISNAFNCSTSIMYNPSSNVSPAVGFISNSNNLSSNTNSLLLYPKCPPSSSAEDALSVILPHARELDIASSLCTPLFDVYSMQNSGINLTDCKTIDHSPFAIPNSLNISKASDQFLYALQNSRNVTNICHQIPQIHQKSAITSFTDLYSPHKQNSTLNLTDSLKTIDQLQYLDLHTSSAMQVPESLWLKNDPQNLMTSHSDLNQVDKTFMTLQSNQDKYNSIYTTTQPSLSQSVQFNIQSLYKDLNFHSLTP